MISTQHDRPHIRFTPVDTITVPKHNCSHVFISSGGYKQFANGKSATCVCRRSSQWIYIPLEVSANYANPVETYAFMVKDLAQNIHFALAVDVELTDAFVIERIGVTNVRTLLEYFDLDTTHRYVQNFHSRRTPNMFFARVMFAAWTQTVKDCEIEILSRPDETYRCGLCDTVTIFTNSDFRKGLDNCQSDVLRRKWGGVFFVLEGLEELFDPPPFQPSDNSMRQRNCTTVSKHFDLDILETTWLIAYQYGYAAKLLAKYPNIRAFRWHEVNFTDQTPFYQVERTQWVEDYEYSWPEVRKMLLGTCLALANLHLPVYVLLELIDWLPLMWLFPRIVKIQTIEQFIKSATKITENRICNKK